MAILFPAQQVPLIIGWGFGLVLTQSHEVLILYRKDFIFAALVEAGSLVGLIIPLVWLGENLTLTHLILLFGSLNLAKGSIFLLRFRQDTLAGFDSRNRLDLSYFPLAFSFFLLGFTGLLSSRVDLYAVNFFLVKNEVGQYQVFSTFLIYMESVSAFILMPFAKNIYRLGHSTILKISIRLFIIGVLILLPSLVAIHLGLTYLYHFTLPVAFLGLGGFSVLPIYFYLPLIYSLYKENLQTTVLKINIFGIVVSLILNLILLPRVGMVGAVITLAVVKWLILVIYLIQGRTTRHSYGLAVSKLSSSS